MPRGECVGVIGRNGAGKSTLLKVLSRITEPTEGEVDLRGRVGSLLEVGTGFHPELTGRENVFLNGAILGMTRAEIARKFDEIVAFAEVERFLDTPVKHYSSGMYMRLAFAVAAHLEPEILIVDEVLAVGDAEFQKKCLGKMGEVAKGGRTVLFVSHNILAIRSLCSHAALMRQGRLVEFGESETIADRYVSLAWTGSTNIVERIECLTDDIRVRKVTVNGLVNSVVNLRSGPNRITIEIEIEATQPCRVAMEVRLSDDQDAPLGLFSPGHNSPSSNYRNVGCFTIKNDFCLPALNNGQFYLEINVADPGCYFHARGYRAVKLNSPGTPTASGNVFNYRPEAGLLFLDNHNL